MRLSYAINFDDTNFKQSSGECEMDFANEHVGFGTTGTQEELILGMSPETCAIVLFNEILGDKDALMITGMPTLIGLQCCN